MKRRKKPNNNLPQHYSDYPNDQTHRWWESRSHNIKTYGRPPKFNDPMELYQACTEYFQWIDTHPFYSLNTYTYKGKVNTFNEPKRRPYTLRGLCLYLNISIEGWRYYKKSKKDFLGVCNRVEGIIYCQKFEGAVLGFFNANIIARELGLNKKG